MKVFFTNWCWCSAWFIKPRE